MSSDSWAAIRDMLPSGGEEDGSVFNTVDLGFNTGGDPAESLESLARAAGMVKDRKYGLIIKQNYNNCLVGHEMISWMVESNLAATRDEALARCRSLIDDGECHHVCDDHHFQDTGLFYRFLSDEPEAVLRTRQAAADLQDVSVKSTLLYSRPLSRAWGERFYALSGSTLHVFKHKVASKPTAIYRLQGDGASCSVGECTRAQQCPAGSFGFNLTIDGTGLALAAADSQTQMRWLECLVALGVQLEDEDDAGFGGSCIS
jgi:hypothetical protein